MAKGFIDETKEFCNTLSKIDINNLNYQGVYTSSLSKISEVDGLLLGTEDDATKEVLEQIKGYFTKLRDKTQKYIANDERLRYMEKSYEWDELVYNRANKLYEEAKKEYIQYTPVEKKGLIPISNEYESIK